MSTYESAKQVEDRVPVCPGIPGDAFKRVQAANAYVKVRISQLIHSFGEALGDLTLAADMRLPPGRYGATYNNEPGNALQHGRPRIIGQPGLSLLQLNAYLRARDPAQRRSAQRRIEQMGDQDDAAQQDDQQAASGQSCEPDSALVHDFPLLQGSVAVLIFDRQDARHATPMLAVRCRRQMLPFQPRQSASRNLPGF
ncbi:MAG TPA: hypothetical protein VKS82_21265 [Streptosporangiaceae bacterium]|nr:hypothetical protein [Streptosporangiaceae bacterium]